MRRERVGRLALLAASLFALAAHGKERVAVASFITEGAHVSANAESYRQSLASGLAIGFDVATEDEVAKATATTAGLQCDSDVCAVNLGKALNVGHVVRGKLIEKSGRNFEIELELVAVSDGRVWANVHEPCDVCSTKELHDLVTSSGAQLKVKLDAEQRRLGIENAARGNTLTAESMKPASDGGRASGKIWALRGAGIAAGAVGVAGLIVGIVEASRHNQPTCDTVPPNAVCVARRDTTGGIVVGFVGFGVFGAAAAALSYLGWHKPRHNVSLLPGISHHAASLELSGNF